MKQTVIKKAPKTLKPIKQSSRLQSQQQQPFSVSRMTVTSRSSGDAPKLCKKCENLVTGMNSDSIHSTLAYSRCRCHRLIKYRQSKVIIPPLDHDTSKLKIESTAIQLVPSKAKLSAVTIAASTSNFDKAPGRSSTRLEEKSLAKISPRRIIKECESVVLPPILGVLDSRLSQTSRVHIEQFPEVASKTQLRGGKGSKNATDSASKLPAITSLTTHHEEKCSEKTNLNSHSKQGCSSWISRKVPMKPTFSTTSQVSDLIEMVKYVDHSKKQQLRDLFRDVDKNGDGHITCAEFLNCLPEHPTCILPLLQQYYAALNDATYFGCREFILCYSITERLISARVTYPVVSVTLDFLETLLSPLMKNLSSYAVGTQVTTENIKDSVISTNQDGNATIYAVSANALNQVFGTEQNKAHILDCLALAPYYLVRRY